MSDQIKLLNLMKLAANRPIVDILTGYPTTEFVRLENDREKNETTILNALIEAVNNITSANDSASSASASVTSIQTTLNLIVRENSLVHSFPQPSNIITAAISSDPTKATITIAGHTRVYGDGSSKTVSGGAISGLSLSTVYYISYVDAFRAGGTVSYTVSTDQFASVQGHDRHSVGVIVTPALGGGPTNGKATMPPGIMPQ